MKQPIPKKCKAKGCTNTFIQRNSFEVVCSLTCAINEGKRKEALKREKELRLNKQLDKLKLKELKAKVKTRTDWLREAQVVFNKWVRNRDKNQLCICCNKHLRVGNVDASHYFSAGAHSNVRFNEDNVWASCSRPCNKDKSGDLINYREGLLKRIGEEKLNELTELSKVQKKWEVEELKQIIKQYKI